MIHHADACNQGYNNFNNLLFGKTGASIGRNKQAVNFPNFKNMV